MPAQSFYVKASPLTLSRSWYFVSGHSYLAFVTGICFANLTSTTSKFIFGYDLGLDYTCVQAPLAKPPINFQDCPLAVSHLVLCLTLYFRMLTVLFILNCIRKWNEKEELHTYESMIVNSMTYQKFFCVITRQIYIVMALWLPLLSSK